MRLPPPRVPVQLSPPSKVPRLWTLDPGAQVLWLLQLPAPAPARVLHQRWQRFSRLLPRSHLPLLSSNDPQPASCSDLPSKQQQKLLTLHPLRPKKPWLQRQVALPPPPVQRLAHPQVHLPVAHKRLAHLLVSPQAQARPAPPPAPAPQTPARQAQAQAPALRQTSHWAHHSPRRLLHCSARPHLCCRAQPHLPPLTHQRACCHLRHFTRRLVHL